MITNLMFDVVRYHWAGGRNTNCYVCPSMEALQAINKLLGHLEILLRIGPQ